LNNPDLSVSSREKTPASQGDWVDQDLLADTGEDECLHFGEPVSRTGLRTLVADAQARLEAVGLQPGGTVALRLAPSVEYVALLLASWRIGAQVSLLDYRLTPVEAEQALDVLGSQVLAEAAPQPTSGNPALRGYAQVTAVLTTRPTGRPARTNHVLIQLSSGSTGPSKVIARTSADLLAELDRYSRLDDFPRRGGRIVLLSSMVHVLGLVGGLLHALHAGLELVLPERLTPVGILDAVALRPAPTTVIGVPFYAELLAGVQSPRPTPNLLRMVVAGELVRPGVPESFTARYNVPLGTMYGMTELGVIATDLSGELRPAVEPVYGLELREDEGELHIRRPESPYLSGGALGEPDPARWSDGWLHTRDAVRLDPGTGQVTILGRRDSQVSIGGLKVDLTEVEQTLCALPGVAQGVVAFADGAIEAFVVLEPDATADAVRAELARRIAGYKLPRRLRVLSELPRTATGKILRNVTALRAATPAPEPSAAAQPGSAPAPAPGPTTQPDPGHVGAPGPTVLGEQMQDQVREFIVGAIRGMNYDVSEVTGDTDLGPAGLDLESLALFELGVLVEDEYKVKFGEDDLSSMALMTLDEFTAAIEVRLDDASAVTAATTTADVQ
jgi:3-hydroxy-4-methylanthranilate adenylyltransferase